MIYNTFKKRKHVIDYDSTVDIPIETVNLLLQQAWEVTPSKQNFMPYNVFVLGPDQQRLKEITHRNCSINEKDMNENNPLPYTAPTNPGFQNILTCNYLLIFCKRLEDQPNAWQKLQNKRGVYQEPLSEKGLDEIEDVISLEIGLFVDALSILCLEKDIDVSYTLCFARNLKYWSDFEFIKRKPMLLMTIGKGKYYKENLIDQLGTHTDHHKPNYDRIVKIIGKESNDI